MGEMVSKVQLEFNGNGRNQKSVMKMECYNNGILRYMAVDIPEC